MTINFNILYTKKTAESVTFQKWIHSNQCNFLCIDNFNISHIVNCKEKINRIFPIVIIDYTICDEDDLKTLSLFIETCHQKSKPSYYAPRPNNYLSVPGPALVFVPSYLYIEKNVSFTLWEEKLVALAQYLPAPLRKLAKKLWNFSKLLKKPKEQPVVKNEMAKSSNTLPNTPEVITPVSLSPIRVDWEPWIAPVHILKKDIINRVDEYFPHPLGIHVILANKCNLACVMCPYHSPKYQAHHTSGYFDMHRAMPFEIFQKIADYAGKHKINLQFGQIEEPLLHKDIFKYFQYAVSVGVPHIHMTTNGTPLNKNNALKLAESGIKSVMFSLDASDPETYEKIRGYDLAKTEGNVFYFLEQAKGRNIKTWVSFILQDQSPEEKERFLQKWKNAGIDNITFYVLTDHDPKTGRFIRTEEHYNKGKRYPCASPWMQSIVFPDGEVSLCCKTMTDVGWRGVVSVGNVKEQSFDAIWKSDRYQAVRNELIDNQFKDFDVCRDCQIWSASAHLTEETSDYSLTYNETMKTYMFKKPHN